MTTFAENVILYPDGQLNVEPVPVNLLNNGFEPKQKGTSGQPLVANWLNWLFRELFRKVNRDRLLDGDGVNAITGTDCMVTVYAVVKTDPTKYLHAVGYKDGNTEPVMNILANSALSFGDITATDLPIVGATSDTIALRVTISESV
jgi:hypothetical protein